MFKFILLSCGLMLNAQAVVIEEDSSLLPSSATAHQLDEPKNNIVPFSIPRIPLLSSLFNLFCSQDLPSDGNSHEKYMSIGYSNDLSFEDATDDSQWEITGNFSNVFSFGSESI
ncbi:hypothetical protein [Candidatus Odyssella acanthamoebae]|uniref:Uncharacterized protein n=1 Tax=Candidatus Odyssella acanthamoebae TaxID=91604 RepID=A0A077AVT8_9PROT|nr:hypothetical protein [Candidatus Paracaedibacter acanthamoebae]AIK97262.1 hypothetical protein ID47_11750 [Candidatus Paracaedibacter acanthamoebae]